MIPKAVQIKHFDRAGNMPAAWGVAADSLLAAARILRIHRDRFDPTQLRIGDPVPDEGKVLFPELMLKGFAVECLLKALWVKLGNKLAVSGKYMHVKGAADHDLVQLAHAVGIRFSPAEKDVLKRLSIIMISSGRYPIPRDWSVRKIQRLLGGGKGRPEFWASPTDDATFERVVEILDRKLDK